MSSSYTAQKFKSIITKNLYICTMEKIRNIHAPTLANGAIMNYWHTFRYNISSSQSEIKKIRHPFFMLLSNKMIRLLFKWRTNYRKRISNPKKCKSDNFETNIILFAITQAIRSGQINDEKNQHLAHQVHLLCISVSPNRNALLPTCLESRAVVWANQNLREENLTPPLLFRAKIFLWGRGRKLLCLEGIAPL